MFGIGTTADAPQRSPLRGGRLAIAALLAIGSLVTYFSKREVNPVTHEVQHIDISPRQEIALGLRAAPEMEQQYGGLSTDAEASAHVARVGQELAEKTEARSTPYRFDYHLLGDQDTINAFALPGGQVFVTEALYRLLRTDGQLAGVLGHETGHVIARHGAEHIAKQQLTQGLTGAAVIATYDPNDPASRRDAQIALLVGQLVNMKFSRNDELEADKWGVRLMTKAGYDPRAMERVMEVLRDSAKGGRTPEFFSTHPNPEHRIDSIARQIRQEFPDGLPQGLKP